MGIVCREDVTVIQKPERVTHTQQCDRMYAELPAPALHGQALTQAPRIFIAVLSALERVNRAFFRVCALWEAVQCWCTFWFSDHRCQAFHGESQRVFTLRASDVVEHIGCRQAREITASCGSLRLFGEPPWMSTGWTLLSTMSPFSRDFSLLAPSTALTALSAHVAL